MSLFHKLLQLPPHIQVLEKLQKVYGSCFPLEIRQYLGDWLEAQLSTNFSNRVDIASSFFEQLLAQIEQTAAALSTYDSYTVKFRLEESARNIRQIYSGDPIQLYKHLVNCMQYERKLLANPMEQVCVNNSGNSTIEITQILLKLKEKMDECENSNRALKREFENYNSMSNDFNKFNAYYEECERQKPELIAQLVNARRQRNEHLMALINRINSLRLSLLENFQSIIEEAEKILAKVKSDFLYVWMKQQKLAALKYVGAQADSNPLDIIQSWFERLAEISWRCYNGIQVMRNFQLHLSQNDQNIFENLAHFEQRAFKLLENLIVSSFIVEKQPSQIIVQEKSGGKKFSTTIRLLIGNVLNTHFNNPLVTVSIISESQAHFIKSAANETTFNIQSGEIVNSIGNLEFNNARNQLSAEFKNMQLKKVKRNDKTGEDKIVDEKFSLLFQTKINVGPIEFNVWTMSLPVIVISHNKQMIDALATVIWDNAFSELHRVPFEEPEKVKWIQLAEVLNKKFEFATGRGLTEENLHFLCEKVLKASIPFPIPENLEVSRSQFCKNPLLDHVQPEHNFSFWKWLFKTIELTHEHLKDQWKDGHIIGFIHKSKTEFNLFQCQPGTFLLRFSESILGGLVVSWKVNYDSMPVKHLKPFMKSDLAIRSISSSIRDLEECTLLYDGFQGIPKNQVFGITQLNLPRCGDNKSNYVERGFRVTYDRNQSQEANNGIKSETQTSPSVMMDLNNSFLNVNDNSLDDLLNNCDSFDMDDFLVNSFQENLSMALDSNQINQERNLPNFNSLLDNNEMSPYSPDFDVHIRN